MFLGSVKRSNLDELKFARPDSAVRHGHVTSICSEGIKLGQCFTAMVDCYVKSIF